MPSPTTAQVIIEDALGLTNAVGVDQTLTADEVSDSLRAFNDLLEIFSTNNLAVYGSANQTFNTVVGQSVYTIGTGGNWNTVRPQRIGDIAYSVINGVTFLCQSMTQEEYNRIAVKGQTQDYPTRYLYVEDFPLGLVTLWPVPSAVVPLTFSIDRILTAISSAAATLNFPLGYAMAFKYKLAIMLAPMFGKKLKDYPDIVQIANDSFGAICRVNQKPRLMSYDPALEGVVASGGSALGRFLGGY